EEHGGDGARISGTETGLVLRLSEEEQDERPRSIEEIEEDSTGRFLAIEPEDPQEGYGDMQAFIGTVAESRFRELLEVAIAGKGAFSRFKDVLARVPDERERWFVFQQERVFGRIRDWLAANAIESPQG